MRIATMNQPVIQSQNFNHHTFGCCTLLHQSINPLPLLAKPSLGKPINYIPLQFGKLPLKNIIRLKINSVGKYSNQGTLYTHTHLKLMEEGLPIVGRVRQGNFAKLIQWILHQLSSKLQLHIQFYK